MNERNQNNTFTDLKFRIFEFFWLLNVMHTVVQKLDPKYRAEFRGDLYIRVGTNIPALPVRPIFTGCPVARKFCSGPAYFDRISLYMDPV